MELVVGLQPFVSVRFKANRASETEKKRNEMLRIGAKKIGQQG